MNHRIKLRTDIGIFNIKLLEQLKVFIFDIFSWFRNEELDWSLDSLKYFCHVTTDNALLFKNIFTNLVYNFEITFSEFFGLPFLILIPQLIFAYLVDPNLRCRCKSFHSVGFRLRDESITIQRLVNHNLVSIDLFVFALLIFEGEVHYFSRRDIY